MTNWAVNERCIAAQGGGSFELIACAPAGMAGTKEWGERAALMAAAPELLAALKDCYDWFENCSPPGATCTPEMRKALAAIAKAGAQP